MNVVENLFYRIKKWTEDYLETCAVSVERREKIQSVIDSLEQKVNGDDNGN